MALIPYFDLIRIPVMFFKTFGLEFLEPDPRHRIQSLWLRVWLLLSLLNYNVQWGFQIVYFVLAMRSSSMLEVTAVAPCLVFGFMGNFKQMTLYLNKLPIRRILRDLEDMHPNTRHLQEDYNLRGYLRTLKPVMKLFAGLCLMNTIYFCLYPLFRNIVDMVQSGARFEYPLGFPIWYPYDPSGSWFAYIATYALQLYGGYNTAVAFLAADLLLVSSVTQLCMHFDYISKSLARYEPRSEDENHRFLRQMLRQHVKCLELSASVDTVFSLSLLLNFLASSGTICFVGFQVIAASSEEIIRFSVLLLISLAQVLIICIYGNMLIDASQAVGQAAFNHPWYRCDLTYRKMVVLMICRSQKFAAIHAPTFPPISLQTFMSVISMSYQFFAVLQTTNDKE